MSDFENRQPDVEGNSPSDGEKKEGNPPNEKPPFYGREDDFDNTSRDENPFYSNQKPPYGNTSSNTPPYGNGNSNIPPYGNGNSDIPPYGNGNSNIPPYGNSGNFNPNTTENAYSGRGDTNFRPPENPYPYANTPKTKKSGAGWIIFIILIIVLLIASIFGIAKTVSSHGDSSSGILSGFLPNQKEPTTSPFGNGPSIDLAETPDAAPKPVGDELSPQEVYQKIKDSSVGILLYSDETRQLASEGSGVIIGEDDDGKYTYIVTCAHVIRPAGMSFKVLLSDDTTHDAKVVGYDNRTDIGVVRIEASGLPKAEFADVSSLAVGQVVYAIGNPGGSDFAGSFTNGMISAIARPISSSSSGYTTRCIQHTAAINPGNSGGALVNAYGQVIGINSMKIVETDYEGMGFAVPSDIVKEIVDDLIANGYIPNRAKLGITYRPATAYEMYSMVVQIRGLPKGSLVIESISEDSDLMNTEAKKGDMIVAVNGKDLDDAETLPAMIETATAGDKLKLSMIRVNADYSLKEFEVTVSLVSDMGSAEDSQTNE